MNKIIIFFITLCLLLLISLLYIVSPKTSLGYDISSWTQQTQLNSLLASQYSFIKDNKIYSLGGANDVTISSGSFSILDSEGNISQWTDISSQPNRYWHSGAVYGNYIYIIGGANSNRINTNSVLLGQTDENGDINSWTETTPLPFPTSLGASFVYKNSIYYAGGTTNGEDSSYAKSEIYKSNIDTSNGNLGQWIKVGDLPMPILGFGMINSGDKLIIIGGKSTGENYLSDVNQATINQTTGDVENWSTLQSLPTSVYRPGIIKSGDFIFSIGGYNITPTFNLLDKIYISKINTSIGIENWTISNTLIPSGNCCMAIATNDKYLYLLGGWTNSYSSDVYKTIVPEIPTPSPEPTVEPTAIPTESPTIIPTAEPTNSPSPAPTFVSLSVPSLKQYSLPWKDKLYAHTRTTINDFGCALTSAAMVLQFHGHNVMPDALNNWLKNQSDGYIRNNLINWLAVSRYTKINDSLLSPTLEYKRLSATVENLDTELNNNRPAILKEDGHFIVATGKNETSYLINDPGYSNRNTLEPYGNKFLAINSYTPTHSDLSYMMFIVNPETNLELLNSSGLVIPVTSYIEEPIKNLSDQIQLSGKNVKVILFEKPEDDRYTLKISGKGIYELESYLYDINGKVTQNKFKEKIIGKGVDSYSIYFENKNKIKQTAKNKNSHNWYKDYWKYFKFWHYI